MRTTHHLIDTSVWIQFLRRDGHPGCKRRVRELLASDQAVLCDPVIFEVLRGCRPRELATVAALFDTIPKRRFDEKLWEAAAELGRRVLAAGFPVPSLDLLIAQTAITHHLTLVCRDQHFTQIGRCCSLRIESPP